MLRYARFVSESTMYYYVDCFVQSVASYEGNITIIILYRSVYQAVSAEFKLRRFGRYHDDISEDKTCRSLRKI